MGNQKKIILCADDFGLNSGVSQGIFKLASMQRISAVSCMVNMPAFQAHANALSALKNQVKIGLHFNLTEGNFLSAPDKACFSLNETLIKSHLFSLNSLFITQEFCAQLEQFVDVMGYLPDFIDGHQHVHQFPCIRRVILDVYQQRFKQTDIAIRSTWPALNVSDYRFKAKILALTGGKALRKQLSQLSIPHNTYFAGIYDFSADTNYRALFRKWLNSVTDQTLIMCHPGEYSNDKDIIASARSIELEYFLSEAFLADCREYDIQLEHC